MFPFPLLGIDTDNGSEFINEDLLAYCTDQQLTFTRGRVANKNDQCWVELCGCPHNSIYADSIMPTFGRSASSEWTANVGIIPTCGPKLRSWRIALLISNSLPLLRPDAFIDVLPSL
jgi:hypothetical protein